MITARRSSERPHSVEHPKLDFLATPNRRKVLFGSLYLSQGAPIGFLWLGLPTRLRAEGVPLDEISWLMAILITPWTMKFLWAPLIDVLRSARWGFRHWILLSQSLMAVSLIPLMWIDVRSQFSVAVVWLLTHAFCAATQDVSIDALCVHQSKPLERAALTGWMQCGVLVGRAVMGGGSLWLEHWIGFPAVVGVLTGVILSSALLVWFSSESESDSATCPPADDIAARASAVITPGRRLRLLFRELRLSLQSGSVWAGFLFALTAPAAFKSLEAIIGPYLIDRGYTELLIGKFSATVMIGGMIVGSLAAGRFAGRWSSLRFLVMAAASNLVAIGALAGIDQLLSERQGWHLLVLLCVIAITIGWFTVALYQWLMNLTSPRLAATQFTAFMAATNACEAWSTWLIGRLQVAWNYPAAVATLCAISALAVVCLLVLQSSPDCAASDQGSAK